MLGASRVFQNTSLPLKKACRTPAFLAASTLEYWLWVQYSSWPEDMYTLCFSSRAAPPDADTSRPEV